MRTAIFLALVLAVRVHAQAWDDSQTHCYKVSVTEYPLDGLDNAITQKAVQYPGTFCWTANTSTNAFARFTIESSAFPTYTSWQLPLTHREKRDENWVSDDYTGFSETYNEQLRKGLYETFSVTKYDDGYFYIHATIFSYDLHKKMKAAVSFDEAGNRVVPSNEADGHAYQPTKTVVQPQPPKSQAKTKQAAPSEVTKI